MDRKTGKWVAGFEGTFREHNRYGYNARIERRQQRAKGRREDLRPHLIRLRARNEEQLDADLESLKIAVHERTKSHRTRSMERNRPRASRSPRPDDNRKRARGDSEQLDADVESLKIAVHEQTKSHRTRSMERNRPRASRSPRPDGNRKRARGDSESPGAREQFRKYARRDRCAFDDNEARRALLEEEKKMDEERRTLWLEEEMRRNALIEAEEKRYEERMEEDMSRRRRQAEEEEERRRMFRLEMREMHEVMEEKLQEANQEMMAWLKVQLSRKKKSSE